jgi:hypothetical protein
MSSAWVLITVVFLASIVVAIGALIAFIAAKRSTRPERDVRAKLALAWGIPAALIAVALFALWLGLMILMSRSRWAAPAG